ncbi:tRNA (adenosine(37)-N6)-threonylcarbamoyltransferase complex dimerization subunit type 1 TsaB [Corticicoccus populi]|uniref:tRNA (Adenosine(37)-N6)-threonylcarbamoyltransferase complex dimerization subunit type 1 TsaB n=1 Tax=Corticicoccus populi TaxID=1812821 RepID=A0ABW5WXP7_9STAP
MISLLIDTSNKPLSIAINKDNMPLAEINVNIKKTHSETLMSYIDQLFKYADIKKSDVDRIIVARGPGSYTGVRIGVTVAKTLAYSLNTELYSVSSLFVLAASNKKAGSVTPIFDARRGNVFAASYTFSGTSFEEKIPPQYTAYKDLISQLDHTEYIGDTTEKFTEEITGFTHVIPRISETEKFTDSLRKENPHQMVPEYLRISEAERNWIEKNQ